MKITSPLLFSAPGQLFEEQACPKPERGIIKADDPIDVCFGITVVPGAHPPFFQETPCQELCQKNKDSVAGTADDNTVIFQPFKQGSDKRGHAVYREHPE